MNLDLNFKGQGLAIAIKTEKVKGVIETAACFASMLVHYEPEEISYDDLVTEMGRLIKSLGSSDNLVLNSRLFYFPTVYLDPWTKECVADYIKNIAPKKTDPEFIAELNGLKDVAQFKRVHSGTEIYPERLPGGYQIFARIPVPIWDVNRKFPVFEKSICLFQPGDRVKFVPCTVEEFEDVEHQIEEGSYQYNLVEYQKFSVKNYMKWTDGLSDGRF